MAMPATFKDNADWLCEELIELLGPTHNTLLEYWFVLCYIELKHVGSAVPLSVFFDDDDPHDVYENLE